MTRELLKHLMETYKSELQSGKVVKHGNYELFVNRYGGYVSIIDLTTDQEIFIN